MSFSSRSDSGGSSKQHKTSDGGGSGSLQFSNFTGSISSGGSASQEYKASISSGTTQQHKPSISSVGGTLAGANSQRASILSQQHKDSISSVGGASVGSQQQHKDSIPSVGGAYVGSQQQHKASISSVGGASVGSQQHHKASISSVGGATVGSQQHKASIPSVSRDSEGSITGGVPRSTEVVEVDTFHTEGVAPAQPKTQTIMDSVVVSMATSSDPNHLPEAVLDSNAKTFWMTTGLYPQELIITYPDLTAVKSITTKTANVRKLVLEGSSQVEGIDFKPIAEKELAPSDGRTQIEDFRLETSRSILRLRVVLAQGYDHFATVFSISSA